MKSLFAFVLLFTSISYGKVSCFKALNPQSITIKTESGKSEKAQAAQLIYQDEKSVDAEGVETPPHLHLRAQSKTLKFSTVAYQFDKGGDFLVECDGGKTSLIKKSSSLILTSDYLAGEVNSADEGCSTGEVAYRNLTMTPAPCAD
ncbi:hypothetical protein [Bdellovibrio bacteriovorus]|uniref:hypothetical protein n=1 Tax=Bdellovibrio bacteriovorus TaxID=959 RepID=UPI0035A5DAB4